MAQDKPISFKTAWPGAGSKSQGIAIFSLLFVLSLAAAEFITFYVNNLIGLICHFIILYSLIIGCLKARDKNQGKLWLALGLIPTIRIISLVIPIAEIAQIYWYLFIAIPLLVAVMAMMRLLRYNLNDIGFNWNQPIIQGIIIPVGFLLGAAGYFILQPEPLTRGLNLTTLLSPALILLLSTGLVEVMIFRGVIQRAANVLGSWDWIYVSAILAVLQIGHGSLMFGVLVFLVSLFFGWVVKKTGSIVGVCVAQGLFNIGMYLIFPFIF